MSEEKNVKQFKECEPAMGKVGTTLAIVQKKMKGNTVLQRQVMNLKRCNWSLTRMLRVSRLQTKLEA
jgi:hypothetical protein